MAAVFSYLYHQEGRAAQGTIRARVLWDDACEDQTGTAQTQEEAGADPTRISPRFLSSRDSVPAPLREGG